MALTSQAREEFLAQPHIGALAVEAGAERAPLVVPIWYFYTPGGELWFLTGATSRKMGLLSAAGRCTLLVETLEPSMKYVSVSAAVETVEASTRERLTEMAARYLPADKVAGYVDYATAEHGEQVKVTLRPTHWVSADLGTV